MEVTDAACRLTSQLPGGAVEVRHELAHEGRRVTFPNEWQDELEARVVIDQNEGVVVPAARALERPDSVAMNQAAGVRGLIP